MKTTGFFCIAIALILLIFNIFSGLSLIEAASSKTAQGHLIRAVSLLLMVVLGNILLFQQAQKDLEKYVLNTGKQPSDLEQPKNYAFLFGFIGILISLTSVVTGTIAKAGQFPLVHGILGFTLVGILILQIVFWATYFTKFS